MKSKFLLCILITALFITLTSCASNEPAPPRERDETFIADINSFTLETIHLYTQRKNGKPKVNNLQFSFNPRTNLVIINTKIGMDFVQLGFSYQDRKALYEAYNKYIEAYNSDAIPNEKPTKKNAYTKGYTLMNWGAASLAYEASAPYITNAQYMAENKPYFKITYSAGSDFSDEHVYSPSFSIYISPSQWEHIIELCNQEALEARVDEIIAEADEF